MGATGAAVEAGSTGGSGPRVLGWALRLAGRLLQVGELLRRPLVVMALIGFAVTGYVTLEGVDQALGAMHLPGDTAGEATGMAPLDALLTPQIVTDVFESWARWEADAGERFLGPGTMLRLYAVVDSLLVALPVTLLLLALLAGACDAIGIDPDRVVDVAEPAELRAVVTGGALAAVAYGLADVTENALTLLVYTAGWTELTARFLAAASLGKVLLLVLAALPWALVARVRAIGVFRARGTAGMAEDTRNRGVKPLVAMAKDARNRGVKPLVVLRAQVLTVLAAVAVLFAIPGEAGTQIGDVVIGLAGGDTAHAVLAAVAAVVLAWLMWTTGTRCIDWYRQPACDTSPIEPRTLGRLLLIGVAVSMVGGVAALASDAVVWVLVVAGAGLALFALLSWPVRRAVGVPDNLDDSGAAAAHRLLQVLTLVPPALLGLVALRAALSLMVARQDPGVPLLLALAMVIVSVVALGLSERLRERVAARPASPGPPLSWWARALREVARWPHGLALLTGAVLVGVWPLAAGAALGTLTITLLFFATVLLVFTWLVGAGDGIPARGALALAGFRRMPWLTLLGALFVAVSALNVSGGYHDARPHERSLGAGDPADHGHRAATPVVEAFDAWLEDQAGPPQEREGAEKEHVPMLFVASAGGGVRAAYWSGRALDCLFWGPAPHCDALPAGSSRNVFAASGISGGSAGLVAFRAAGDGEQSTAAMFTADFLAPSVAAMAFRDTPNSLLQLDVWDDRAAVLERAWEKAADDNDLDLREGFVQSARTDLGRLRFPLLLLNGTAVEDGCRVTASILRLAPASEPPAPVEPDTHADQGPRARRCLAVRAGEGAGAAGDGAAVLSRTRDAFDYTCFTGDDGSRARRDLRLSTVALLSARFPFVSPSGGMPSCVEEGRRTFVVDGGVIDSSAASPLVELWSVLSPLVHGVNADPDSGVCVEPRLLLLDNDYARHSVEPVPRRPQELAAPVQALLREGGGTSAAARQAAVIAFQASMVEQAVCRHPEGSGKPPTRMTGQPVVHLYPSMHPGPRAPLGWTLSSWAQRDLDREFRSERNLRHLDRIHSWFSPPAGGRLGVVAGMR